MMNRTDNGHLWRGMLVTRSNPLFVHEDSLLRLQAGLHNDTLFLASNNVMDYSLAIGIDEENQELHVGIIGTLDCNPMKVLNV